MAIDYTLHPGESIANYNARIANERGDTPAQLAATNAVINQQAIDAYKAVLPSSDAAKAYAAANPNPVTQADEVNKALGGGFFSSGGRPAYVPPPPPPPVLNTASAKVLGKNDAGENIYTDSSGVKFSLKPGGNPNVSGDYVQYNGSVAPPPPSGIGNPVNPPSVPGASSGNFTPPTPTSGGIIDSYFASASDSAGKLKFAIQEESKARAADYQTKINVLNKQQEDLKILQENAIIGQNSATALAVQQKVDTLAEEKQRFDENYNASQSLIGEMDSLLTEGNALIAAQKAETGLAAIRNPRIDKTITDVAARAGVIKTLLDARSGQMGQAQAQLRATTDAVSSMLKDNIDYYSTLQNFYKNQKDENGKLLVTLTSEQKDYLDANLTSLKADLTRVEKNAQMISDAMIDPDTALLYNKAGVSLTDTQTQIGEKLAKQIKWNLANGYNAAGTVKAKAEVVAVDNMTMFIQAEKFITDNPNASAEELAVELRKRTKLSDGDISALIKKARPEGDNTKIPASVRGNIEALKDNNAPIDEINNFIRYSGYKLTNPEIVDLLNGYGDTSKQDAGTPWWKKILNGLNPFDGK